MKLTGSQAVMESLLHEGVDTIFGYPGGANMPIYDVLYDYKNKLRHILVRHEQGAAHAAEGYARVTGKPGVCFATSGPGATNLVTGIADAMMDSVPMVCVTGQVAAHLLGSDAFQEADVIGITTPITKWNYQITKAEEIGEVFQKAFYIATHGRPGPVVIDITKSAQFENIDFQFPKKVKIEKFLHKHESQKQEIINAAQWINKSKKPLLLVGHGVLISKAEEETIALMIKAHIPAAVTLHGLSAIPCDHPLYVGMLGMHGNYAPNILTNQADVIVALGMRFDDRVTSDLSRYARQAKIIHIDIDASELHKNVIAHIAVHSDVKKALTTILPMIKKNNHSQWITNFYRLKEKEKAASVRRDRKRNGQIRMDEVISALSSFTNGQAIIVADVGQNQMFSARFYGYKNPNSYITSGGLGTMGFALPAAIGAYIGAKNKEVYVTVGDGGFQMNIQELGTIMQEKLPVKIIILNNRYLGMVRQWQQLFFKKRYSFTSMLSPDFVRVADAYGIAGKKITQHEEILPAIKKMRAYKGPYLLEVEVEPEDNIFPMIPAGASVEEVRLEE